MSNLTPSAQLIADMMVAAHKAVVAGVSWPEVARMTRDFALDLKDIADPGDDSSTDHTKEQSDG